MAKTTLIIVNACASIALAAALTSHAVAHEVDVWIAADGPANYTLSIDGAPAQSGYIWGRQSWPQEIWVSIGDGSHAIGLTTPGGIYVTYLTYDGAAVPVRATNGALQITLPMTSNAPPAAQAAGFTTLALNSDFSQPLATNWLGGCPGGADWSSPLDQYHDDSGHDWWINLWSWWPDPYGLCNVAQVTDPDGQLTLDLLWQVDTRWDHAHNGAAIQSASRDYNRIDYSPPRGQATGIPNNFYIEAEFRMSPVEPSSFGAVYLWSTDGIAYQSGAGMEFDVAEWDVGNVVGGDTVVHNFAAGGLSSNWIMGPFPAVWAAIDPTQYHRFGMRSTSDGTNEVVCGYLDDVLQRCVPSPGFNAVNANQRYFVILQSFCDYWNYPNQCNGRDGKWQHLLARHIKVWSCPSWQTTQCNGQVLSN